MNNKKLAQTLRQGTTKQASLEDNTTSTISLSVEDVPAIVEWQDGGEYTITLTIRQDKHDKDSGVYTIQSIDVVDKPQGDDFVKVAGLTPSVS